MKIIVPKHRSSKQPFALAAALLVAASAVIGQAQPAATNAPPVKAPWETTAAAGLTLSRGNSDTLMTTLGLDTRRKWKDNEAALGITGGYGENDHNKNTEYVNAFAQYNRMFTERLYAGLRTDFNYDGIADLSYRVTISPLAGYYVIKETNTTLAFELGPSLVFEKYQNQGEETYLAARLGERFEHKLTPTTKIWQSVEYVPKVEEWADKYLITAEAGIDTAITKSWSMRVVFQNIYDSQPANGRDHNDMRLIAGTAYKF
jgi:putative salt-induced outer membrane protein YdiY